MASASKDRSRAIAFTTGGLALGMMMGPAFQLIFTPIGYPGFRLVSFQNSGINLSMYTAPALMACLMNVVNVISIRFLFREKYASLVHSSKSKSSLAREEKKRKKECSSPTIPVIKITSACSNEKVTEVEEDSINFVLPKYDRAAIALCHLSRFTQMFVKTNLDTIGAPLAATLFAWNAKEVIEVLSTSQAIMSAIAFSIYLSYIFLHLDKIVNFRKACILSLFALVVFHVVTFSYPFLPRKIQTYNSTALFPSQKFNETYGNFTLMKQNGHHHSHPLGCDVEQFSWCSWVRVPNPYLLFGTYTLIVGVAFSNLNISLNTLFSKILGPRRQGTQQGILQMSGGAARMIGPLFVSSIYISSGPAMVWIFEVVVVLVNLLLWIILYRRMIPLRLEDGLLSSSANDVEANDSMSRQNQNLS